MIDREVWEWRLKNWGEIILILVALIFLLNLIAPARAFCVVENQGDTVYLNETCDVSKVVSWGAQFAFFSSGTYGENPDKIVDASGFIHKFFIDPQKFVVGDWYKWDGRYERAGYPLAFRVKNGPRPNVTLNQTINVTTPLPAVLNLSSGPITSIMVARGEALDYVYTSSEQGNAWLWLFEGSNMYLGMPMNYIGDAYHYVFLSGVTQSFPPKKYNAYIQFGGMNKRQDVFYYDNALHSVYKDVNDVYLVGNYTKAQYDTLFLDMVRNTSYSDDTIVKINLTIEEPNIIIRQFFRDGDFIVLEGTTSLSPQTKINAIIDPHHWTTTKEQAANTYQVNVTGDVDSDRLFSVRMPILWDEMSIGEHDIVLSAQTDVINLQVHKELQISDTYVFPTPTPSKVKVLLDENGRPVVTAVIPTPTPEPTIIPVTSPTVAPVVPVVTTTIPIPVNMTRPVPKSTMITVPLEPGIGLAALGVLVLFRRKL